MRREFGVGVRCEALEARLQFSAIPLEADAFHDAAAGHASGAEGKHGPTVGPAIRLDLVALHEFGHALGLDHNSSASSIMYAYYNADYNLSNFADDPAVAQFRSLFANINTSPWTDSADPVPNDGKVEITYSFVPDGTKMEGRKSSSNMFSTFNSLYGSTAAWEQIFTDALNRWAGMSNGNVSFVPHSDSGLPFNYSGNSQNDVGSGDIRIGTHKFDGPSSTLAHTYFPPPNGATAAGDSHYDSDENWDGKRSSALVSSANGLPQTSTTLAGVSFEGGDGLSFKPVDDSNSTPSIAMLVIEDSNRLDMKDAARILDDLLE